MAQRSSSTRRTGGASKSRGGSGKRKPASRRASDDRLISDRTRRDLIGVIFIVLAVALLMAALMQSDAIVTSSVSAWLYLAFGVGAILVPIFLAAIGVSFIIRFERHRVQSRV